MARHNTIGVQGEALACSFFTEKGYIIHYRNWRYSHYEIDIIAQNNDVLHFIEVKTRTSSLWGQPEEAVTRKKIHHLLEAGREFLYQNPQWKKIQFDVLSIQLFKNRPPEFFLIEDVYLHDE
ncbi:MAG TPA: YraN family protein [Chitinophagaceae bacterium]|nr:YraN family protein [Chitinophagaceae bacterium]